MRFWVAARYIDEDGQHHRLASGEFDAETADDARECAMQSWWDPRLEAAGCSPDFEVRPAREENPNVQAEDRA